jgi:hypothetical protein
MIRGLEAHEFERVLKSAKFTERVCDLAAFTLKHSTEGGLAVYKNLTTAKLSISKVDTPDVKKMREDVELGILDIWNYQTSSEKQVLTSSASGKNVRPTVHVTLELKGRKISTIASVIDRSHMRYPMIVGRRDLKGFLVNPEIEGDTEEMTEDGHLVSTLGTS